MSFPFTHLQLERPFKFKVRCPAKLPRRVALVTFQVESTRPTRAVLLKHHKLAGTALGQSCIQPGMGSPFPAEQAISDSQITLPHTDLVISGCYMHGSATARSRSVMTRSLSGAPTRILTAQQNLCHHHTMKVHRSSIVCPSVDPFYFAATRSLISAGSGRRGWWRARGLPD